MSYAANLRAWMVRQPAIGRLVGDRVHHVHVPQKYAGTYVWFARGGRELADTLEMAAGTEPLGVVWDVEAISRSPDEVANLVELLEGVHGHRGAFGDGTVQGVFVDQQADGYVPQGLGIDLGLEVAAFSMTIYGYAS